MEFLEHKTELVCFLSITDETKVIYNPMDDDVWEDKDERTGAFIGRV